MDLATYLGKYIGQTIDYPTRHVVTKNEFNDILNLLITQGDYNTEALEEIVPTISSAITSDNVLAVTYDQDTQRLQLTVDGVAWVDAGPYDVTLVPHTHGNITADGKLLVGEIPASNHYVKTDSEGNLIPVENIATSEATPSALMQRDENGRAKVADPVDNGDIANKGYTDTIATEQADAVIKVGDVVLTKRASLGEDYALCNGAAYDTTLYPDYAVLDTGTSYWNAVSTGEAYAAYSQCYSFNGYFFRLYVNNSSAAVLQYATSLSGEWTTITLGAATDIKTMKYVNGMYIVCVYQGFFYCDVPNGTWTFISLNASHYCVGVVHTGTYWVALMNTGTSTVVRYATTINGTYTAQSITHSGTAITGTAILWDGAKLIVTNSSGVANAVCYATTPATASWTSQAVGSGSSFYYDIEYINNTYIVVGRDNGSSAGVLCYATSLTGTWTKVSAAGSYYCCTISYTNGHYFLMSISGFAYGTLRIDWSASLSSGWTGASITGVADNMYYQRGTVCYDGTTYFAYAGRTSNTAMLISSKSKEGNYKLLPTLTTTGFSNFLRVK